MTDDRHANPRNWPAAGTAASLRFHLSRWSLLVIVAVVTYLAFPTPDTISSPVFTVGETADRTVIAPIPFTVRTTEEEIAREGESRALVVRPVYRFEAERYDSVMASLRRFFSAIDRASPSGTDAVRRAAEAGGVRLSAEEAGYLGDGRRRRVIADSLTRFMGRLLASGVADAGALREETSEIVTLERAGRERTVVRDSIRTFSDLVERAESDAPPAGDPVGQRIFRRLVAAVFQPTVVYDAELTASRRGQLRLEVDSLKYRVRAGERIVGIRDEVSPEVRDKLLGLRDELRRRGTDAQVSRTITGPLIYNVLLLAPFWLLMLLYRRETWAELREMGSLAVLFAMVILVSRGITTLFPGRPELVPIPLAALVVAVLYNGRIAMLAAITLAVVLGEQWALRSGGTLFFGVVGGTAASVSVRVLRRRRRLYVTLGVIVGAYALAAVAAGLTFGWSLEATFSSALAGFVVALGSTSVAMVVLPLAESATRITTDLTLLELADPTRPLLRRLAVEAPGTWAHSVAMANLCESACAAIGANGLLARVGCYYHDVGKLARPQYFVENQARGINPHDQLSPEQSAEIIREHVREGLRLAEEARLPPVVRAFIPEHHGTAEIRYFLHRARGASDKPVDAASFRYPGPRPQSAETAVAMLADSAEAIVRTIGDPTPEAVRVAIDTLVADRLASGQLDEAPLTLRDLDLVRNAFARVIVGVYHHRVEYPPPTPARGMRAVVAPGG